jgi:hypothetical protein
MAEYSRLWDAVAGTPEYDDTDISELFRDMVKNGYIYETGTEFDVNATSPVSMNVQVTAGRAFIQGYWYKLDATKTLAITAADPANARIDRVVIEADITNRTVIVKMVDGTPAAIPSAPALTQTATKWQLSLAQIYVDAAVVTITDSDITEEKNDDDLCGYSIAPSQSTPTSVFDDTVYHLTGSDAGTTINHGNYPAVVSSPTKIYAIGGTTDTNQVSIFTPSTTSADGTWASGTDVTTGRYAGAAVFYDDGTQERIYYIGGWDGAITEENERYNVTDDNWTSLTNMPTPRYGLGAALLSGSIYCAGGAYSNKMEAYNIAGNSWTTKTNLPTTPINNIATSMTRCVTYGSLVYIAFTDTGSNKRFYSYNPTTDVYTALTAPAADVSSGLFVIDGYIYGLSANKIYRYSISGDSWETLNSATGINVSTTPMAGIYKNSFFQCTATTAATAWFTYIRDLSITVSKTGVAAFVNRNDSKYKLFNTVSLAGGDSIGIKVGQGLKLYVNDSTATASADIEVLL